MVRPIKQMRKLMWSGGEFAASGIGFSMVFRCRRYELLHELPHGRFHGTSLHNNNNKTSYSSLLSSGAHTTTIIIPLHIATTIKDAVLSDLAINSDRQPCCMASAYSILLMNWVPKCTICAQLVYRLTELSTAPD